MYKIGPQLHILFGNIPVALLNGDLDPSVKLLEDHQLLIDRHQSENCRIRARILPYLERRGVDDSIGRSDLLCKLLRLLSCRTEIALDIPGTISRYDLIPAVLLLHKLTDRFVIELSDDLAALVRRAPDVHVVVHLGDDKT